VSLIMLGVICSVCGLQAGEKTRDSIATLNHGALHPESDADRSEGRQLYVMRDGKSDKSEEG